MLGRAWASSNITRTGTRGFDFSITDLDMSEGWSGRDQKIVNLKIL